MDHMKFETPDIVEENIEKIAALFPSAVTEMQDENGNLKKGINFEVLKQLLSKDVVDGDECYEFTWVGKKAAMAEAAKPTTKTLRPVKEDSKDWDTTENLYIEGDNLEVLKILQESYLGKVKMIYIDPPYNTGHDFIYPDSFVMDNEEYSAGTGYFDDEGNVNFARENSSNAGKYHSDWCSMMYSRLILARNLLEDDGLIFISMDDNELTNLLKICNEVFGENNYITDIVWEKRYTRNNDAKLMSTVIDHILCYRKSEKRIKLREPRTEKQNSIYSNPDNDPRGVWTSVLFTSQRTKEERPNLSYAITNPYTGDKVVHPTNAWKYSENQYKVLAEDNRLYWGKNGDNAYPRIKRFLSELEDGIVPVNLWSYKDTATLDEGTKNVDSMLGKNIFNYPKPYQLVTRMLSMMNDKECLILDFFSGSATTAHAVMQLNAEDGGHRKFIMVQLPEPCNEKSEAKKAGYDTICEIGKERIRRAGEKIKEDNPLVAKNLDIGFRVFYVDKSNMKDVYYHPEELDQMFLNDMVSNIKEDRTDMDLLYSCLLDWGVEINLPHTTTVLDGCTIHNVDNGALMACFNEKVPASVIQYMAKQQPLRAVFRDSSFAADDAKINVEETFKNFSPDTSVRVI